jgi:hypothetical protein
MFPVVVYEHTVHVFSFYHNDAIQQAMSHQTKLYRLVGAFSVQQRSQAYTVGCHLSHHGGETVITVSQQHYKVWVDLRSCVPLEKLAALVAESLASSKDKLLVSLPAC